MKKLKKSKNKMICGVCGGIAEFFNIDPTIIRLIFIIITFIGFGTGLLVYIISAFVIPNSDAFADSNNDDVDNLKSANVSESETKGKSKAEGSNKNKKHSDEEFDNYFN